MIRPRPSRLARSGLCYVPEQSWLCPRFTLADHFDAIRRCFRAADVAEAVDLLSLGELIERKPRQLSGGERRRADLALAVARAPDCLLMDEPFLGLSPTDSVIVAKAVQHLAANGCAIVITGHEVEQLLATCEDVLWQTAGTTHHLGSAEHARAHDQFRREYLGPRAGIAPQPG